MKIIEKNKPWHKSRGKNMKKLLIPIFCILLFSFANALTIDQNNGISIPDGNIRVLDDITISVNIQNDINFDINALGQSYFNTISEDTKIIDQNITVPPDSNFLWQFQFVPQSIGLTQIIVLLDGNQMATKQFDVKPQQEFPSFEAYVHSLLFSAEQKDCAIRFSTGERIIFRGIIEDNNSFFVSFLFTDFWGNQLLDISRGKINDRYSIAGHATVHILSIGADTANILYLFSSPVSVEDNDCEVNVPKLFERINTCVQERDIALQARSDAETAKTVAEKLASERIVQIETLNTSLASTTMSKNSAESQLIAFDAECDFQINEQKQTEEQKCNALLSTKDQEKGLLLQEKSVADENTQATWVYAIIGWFLFVITSCAFFVYNKYQFGGI